uniref:Reverse transcriptase domain-containing protein n=1 Tax=Triticum urartu TaxID=4572 RepID=A0A8R7JXX3_TRIUA
MLFTIAIDVLNSLIQHAIRCNILQRLSPRHMTSSIPLYADDVVVFCHPDPTDLSAR